MAKRWKKQELTYLKRYSTLRRVEDLAKRFKTDTETVRTKLRVLELEAKDMKIAPPDPAIAGFEKGLKALYSKKWSVAAKYFREVIAKSYSSGLIGRATQFLAASEEKLAAEGAQPAVDPYLDAVMQKNRGNLQESLDICSRGGRQGKDHRFSYLSAAICSLMGEHKQAAKFLGMAIERDPRYRVHARSDTDLDDLRDQEEYKHLFDSA